MLRKGAQGGCASCSNSDDHSAQKLLTKHSEALGGVRFYFCEPHHPWQKPSVENTNRLIREFFPKGTDFSKVTDEEVQHVFDMINDRPRKVLGFRTANEVYREMLHLA